LCWRVVGQRGEKRLTNGYNREITTASGRGRGAGASAPRPARGVRGMRGFVARGGTDKGKRTRNSSESDQEQQPLRKQRGGKNRGQTRASAATGSNRVAMGASGGDEQTNPGGEGNAWTKCNGRRL
jgi:hypothetical protein